MNNDPEVLFEDNHIIAVNKPNNILIQVDKTGDDSLEEQVIRYIKQKYNKPGNVFLGVIHRIDRPVSGVVLFAKSGKALTRLNKMVKEREFQKTYLAIVKNKPPLEKGELRHFIGQSKKHNKSFIQNEISSVAKEAILKYSMVANSENYFLINIDLITGRHHQIRCQLAAINCPIKGDLKYGFNRSNPNGGIDLHAYKISFEHPVSKEKIEITAPTPKNNLWDYFANYLVK